MRCRMVLFRHHRRRYIQPLQGVFPPYPLYLAPMTNHIVNLHQQPFCTWLDYDHTNNLNTGAMQIHMTDFSQSPGNLSTTTKEYYCDPKRMIFRRDATRNDVVTPSLWPFTVGGTKRAVDARSHESSRHNTSSRSSAFASRLITSKHREHSAAELCADGSSYGPDFVSLYENTFCDMESKTAWPLCSKDVKTGCFDYASYTLLSRRGVVERGLGYDDVTVWG